ncbi:MAG: AraC family transcriptional regulator ligand-binding domain-containing protein [Alphaproteobacteria bacterium]|nr:AraC family transcriptional regulator ligand-binding domain-containing protein [Alphaproteobacteria bacterium]
MEPIALTRASQLIHVTETLERLGESPEHVLALARLPMWHNCDPDDLIPTCHIYALMDQAARCLGSPTFGLRVGADNGVAALGTLGRLVASAHTIHHAFETSCRLIHAHSSAARNWLAEEDDEVWFCRNRLRGPKAGRQQMEQCILMQLIDHVGMAAGPSWRPAKVCLQMHEDPGPELRDELGNPEIRLGQDITGIAVPRALLTLPLRRCAAAGCAGNLGDESRLRSTAPADSFIDTLRQLIGSLLKEEGTPLIETVAEIAGVSVRSLQRRLSENGSSYTQVVDQARYQAATRLLRDPDLRITDIAIDLGYTDSAHFTRAFKRWAGVTPSEYRRQRVKK